MILGLSYIKAALIIVAILGIGYIGVLIYNAGRDSVYDKLKDDRITILQDGKKIDSEALSADDDELRCLLIDCVSNDKKPK